MDTPTETPHELTSDDATNAPVTETATPALHGAETSTASAASNKLRADDPAWGVGAAIGVWLASVGLLVGGGVLALIGYLVVRWLASVGPLVGGGVQALIGYPVVPSTSMNVEELLRALPSDPLLILLSVVATLPVHLLTFGVAWAVVTGFGKRPFREAVGWGWGGRLGFWSCVGMAVGLWLFGILLARQFGGQETDIDRIISSSTAARFSIAFLAVATAPIVEETIYRGVLFAPLQRAAGTKAAVVIVSLLFAGVHFAQYWNNLGVVAAVTVLSFTLTWVRAHTGRLLPCFAIHAAFNGIQAIIIVAQPYLKSLTPTQPGVPPGMLLDTLAHALLRIQI